MITSLFVQRTNNARAVRLYVLTVLASITVVSLAFPAFGIQLPEWVVLAGRWIPALVSLLVLRLVPLEGGIGAWWRLRAGGVGRFFAGLGVGVLGLAAVYALTATIASLLGIGRLQTAGFLLAVLPTLVVTLLLITLSTFGEEVGWRGFLQQLLETKGFWGGAARVSAVWVLFHVPVHGVMAAQGTLSWGEAALVTVPLFALGLFLSAAVARFGSVWPAVFGHALPLASVNLLQDPGSLGPGERVTVAALEFELLLVAASIVAPRRKA